jgi:hypothetical protein
MPPPLRRRLEELIRDRPRSETEDPSGWRLTVDGVVLARAKTIEQLRANAVCESPLLVSEAPEWHRLAALLHGAPNRALVVVEGGLTEHLVLSVGASMRPRARRVDTLGLLGFILSRRLRSEPVEVLTSASSSPELVSRIGQVARLNPEEGASVGLQYHDRLMLVDAHRQRTFSLERAFLRPRRIVWLPEQPELQRSLRRPFNSSISTVHCTVWPEGESKAALYYLDQLGTSFRETFDRFDLEPRLLEARALLSSSVQPTVLSVNVHPTLAALAGRRATLSVPDTELDVECNWPGTVRLWLDGEVFGGPGDLSLGALAEALLSRWPPGTWGNVRIRRLTFARRIDGASPLLALVVRSRVLRRLDVGLRRVARTLLAA